MSDASARPPYGPNTPRVRRFLQRAAALAPEAWARAARRYAELQGTAPFIEADYGLGAAIEASGRGFARDAVVRPVVQLAASRGRAGEASADDAAEALLAAALALVVIDRLDADLFETLFGPFADAIPLGEL